LFSQPHLYLAVEAIRIIRVTTEKAEDLIFRVGVGRGTAGDGFHVPGAVHLESAGHYIFVYP
jgi:hypothetical protein